MNRVASDKYPDTIEGVIYQPGQYQCVTNSHINKEPSESSYEAAESILDGRRMFRSSVVYQAEFIQGKVVEKCDICGAKLDAGEKCDCLKEIKLVEMRWQQVSEEDEEGGGNDDKNNKSNAITK